MDRRELVRMMSVAAMGAAVPVPEAFAEEKKGAEPEVTATEDLMREHGVLRRTLLVYSEIVPRLRQDPAKLDAASLHKAAELFRRFGEQYHEQMLEEQHIFPVVRKLAKNHPRAAAYPDVLTAQHTRGREVTDYILAVTNQSRIATSNADPLAKTLESFVRMYQNHAAREDTIVFPAWKTNFTNKQLDEVGDQFEEIEHKMFGKDGFEDAERTISQIEQTLGMSDIAQFTPPPPPNVESGKS
jgi:hemerythrin-like domain-containing protein